MGMILDPYTLFPAASGGSDPYWANVVSLIHFDEPDGSTAITDEKGNVWTRGGSAIISAAAAMVGTAAGRMTTGNSSWQTPHSSIFNINESQALTLEFRFKATAAAKRLLVKKPTSNTSGFSFAVNSNLSSSFVCHTSGGIARSVGGTAAILALNTPYAMALTFDGTNWRTFLDGILVLTIPAFGDIAVSTAGAFSIGLDYYNTGTAWRGDVDEFRLTKGICRYTSDYTVDPNPFPNS